MSIQPPGLAIPPAAPPPRARFFTLRLGLLTLTAAVVVGMLAITTPKGASRPATRRLTIAVVNPIIEGGKALEDITRIDPNGSHPLLLRWLLNLVYEPCIRYKVDETVAVGEAPRPRPSNIRDIYEGTLMDLSDFTTTIDPMGKCVGSFVLRKQPPVFFADGTGPLRVPQLEYGFASFRSLIRNTYSDSSKVEIVTESDRVRASVENITGCQNAMLGLVLSVPRAFTTREVNGQNMYVGTGPFRFAQSGEQQLILTRNERHPMAAQLGIDEIEFAYYQDLNDIASGNARVDMVISNYDVYRRAGREPPERMAVRMVPIGMHYFAVVNRKRVPDEARRTLIWKKGLEPARERLFANGDLPRLEALSSDYWFPAGWASGSVMQAYVPELKQAAFGHGLPEVDGEARLEGRIAVLLVGGVLTDDTREPFVGYLRDALRSAGAREVSFNVASSATTDWGNYDIVLFRREFDPLFGDPSQLLTGGGIGAQIESAVTDGNERLKRNLGVFAGLILNSGPNNASVAERTFEIQQDLAKDISLFPLFTVPTYIYYDKAKMDSVKANYREGFVSLANWGLRVEPPVITAKGGCGGTPQ